MSSLRGRLLNAGLRAAGFQHTLARDLARGRVQAHAPGAGLRAGRAWAEREVDGRTVHRFGPRERPGSLARSDVTYLHLHGGGFVTGLLRVHLRALVQLADLSGASVLAPDYPLPPGSDAAGILAFCDRVLEDALRDGPVVLGGDSAGGTLAILLAAARAREGRPLPRRLVLWSPLCDLRVNAGGYDGWDGVIEPDGVRAGAARFAGTAGDAVNPALVPLEGLPPTTVFAGTRDPLYPDIAAWIARAREAGVDVQAHAEPGLGHYWMFLPQPEAARTLRQVADAVTSTP